MLNHVTYFQPMMMLVRLELKDFSTYFSVEEKGESTDFLCED